MDATEKHNSNPRRSVWREKKKQQNVHLRIILGEVVLLSGRTVPVVVRVRHRQPIGLAVEIVDLARGHGLRQRLPAAVRLELRVAVAAVLRRQLNCFVVQRLPVRVVLLLLLMLSFGRQVSGGHASDHAALAKRRPLFLQYSAFVLEQPLLEQLLLEPGLVQRIPVRVVESLGHGGRRRPGRHVLPVLAVLLMKLLRPLKHTHTHTHIIVMTTPSSSLYDIITRT